MKTLSVSEARKHLPALVKEVAATREEVVITRNGKALARIVGWDEASESSATYPLRGFPLGVPEDFDEPMEDLWEALGR